MSEPEPGSDARGPVEGRAFRGGRPGSARAAAVRRLEASGVGSRALQRLTELAVRLLQAPCAQVSLLGDEQVVAGAAGLAQGRVGGCSPLEDSLCTVTAAAGPAPLVVVDATADDRVFHLPPVTSGAVRSYLGIPLPAADGEVIGALSVFGPEPRDWSPGDVAVLSQLADSVSTELELSALTREYEASRLRFELAIDAAEIGSFDWDLVSGRLVWDDRLIELFGYDRATFDETIEAFNARLHPDDLPRVSDAIETAIAGCGVYEAEYRIVLPTGETRWIMGRGRCLGNDLGTAQRMLGAAYDTTRQRHGDAQVARVLETMNAAFFSLDRHWRFTYVNGEAEHLLQRSREELLGGSIWELFTAAVGSEFEEHYRGAMATGQERVFEAYYPAPLDAWYEVRAWPGPDGLSVYFLDITERRQAAERAARTAARLALVAQVSELTTRALGGAPDEEAALRQLVRAVIPVLGDWAIVTIQEEDGRFRDVGTWHRDPTARKLVERYAQLRFASIPPGAPVFATLRSGQLITVPDIPATLRQFVPGDEAREILDRLAPSSAVVYPLRARDRVIGALSVYRSADRRPADEEELATGRDVADRAALAIDNARLHEQHRRLAEALQRSMLTDPPVPEHAEIVVRYQPAVEVAQVGGDWYDAFLQPDGATMLVIGDVVGHDTAAAAAMGQLRGLLRGIAFRAGAAPAAVLSELDAAIQGLAMDTMATAAIARFEQTPDERASGITRLRWSNAGHPAPLLLHADGRIEELSGERPELMLGIDPSARRSDAVTTFRRGATVLLYTDGLIEGRDQPLDDGMRLLRATLTELAALPLQELCDQLIARLRPGGLEDDVALVAIRLHPQ